MTHVASTSVAVPSLPQWLKPVGMCPLPSGRWSCRLKSPQGLPYTVSPRVLCAIPEVCVPGHMQPRLPGPGLWEVEVALTCRSPLGPPRSEKIHWKVPHTSSLCTCCCFLSRTGVHHPRTLWAVQSTHLPGVTAQHLACHITHGTIQRSAVCRQPSRGLPAAEDCREWVGMSPCAQSWWSSLWF